MGAAAAVELAVELRTVPNFSCRRRTSRGGLATEFTNAIFTCRPGNRSHQKIQNVTVGAGLSSSQSITRASGSKKYFFN